jgi:hypothetical protein
MLASPAAALEVAWYLRHVGHVVTPPPLAPVNPPQLRVLAHLLVCRLLPQLLDRLAQCLFTVPHVAYHSAAHPLTPLYMPALPVGLLASPPAA